MCYLIYRFLRGASPHYSPRIGNAPQAQQELQISSQEISNKIDSLTISIYIPILIRTYLVTHQKSTPTAPEYDF